MGLVVLVFSQSPSSLPIAHLHLKHGQQELVWKHDSTVRESAGPHDPT